MKHRRKIFAAFLIFSLLLSFAACSKNTSVTKGVSGKQTDPLQPAAGEPMRAATSYEEVRTQLQKQDVLTYGMPVTDGTEQNEAVWTDAPAAEEDYSGTNIQVEGVDEADIIKTDGKYIYALFGSVLQIIRADGEHTALVSEIVIEADSDSEDLYPAELYISGNDLWVLAEKSIWDKDGSDWYLSWEEQTAVLVYDVSDPAAPRLEKQLGQDGMYCSSRLTDGRLYLITQNYLYDDLSEDSDSWVPRTYCGGTETLLPPENIYLCSGAYGSSLTLAGVYDCAGQSLSDVCSFTGGTDCIYMSRDCLYIAQSSAQELTSEPYTENQYTVTDYQSAAVTQIHRVRAKDGKLTPDGSATVSGSLLNQFSMDEYDGMLRLAVTTDSDSYSVYRDEKYDFENYVWGDNERSNVVIVLDSDMKVCGELTDLVADERIYSVRFMGETAYVVTYEQIDPVFTVDLSDPAKPTVRSALEVLGVSDYLQGYGEGLLFGFGRALDTNAVSNGLQLSMFDTTDPENVRLLDKVVLDDKYSEALYNHKALLISTEKNLIAFPDSDGQFYVYGFADGVFSEKGSFSLRTSDIYMGGQSIRGLYIGNDLYILCGQELFIADLTSFETVAQISFAEG